MPIYEYKCGDCGAKCQLLIGVVQMETPQECPTCGSLRLTKLVSRFRVGRNEDARVDELADRLDTMAEPASPASMRQLVREMGKAMDEDVADDMEEMFESDMESGPGEAP